MIRHRIAMFPRLSDDGILTNGRGSRRRTIYVKRGNVRGTGLRLSVKCSSFIGTVGLDGHDECDQERAAGGDAAPKQDLPLIGRECGEQNQYGDANQNEHEK